MRYVGLFLMIALAQGFGQITFTGKTEKSIALAAGEVVEVNAGLVKPSELPANARIEVSFAGIRKVVHALDPDVFFYYRAPKAGDFVLRAAAVEEGEAIFNNEKWREIGTIGTVERFPRKTPWPAGKSVGWRMDIRKVALGSTKKGMVLELEPNDGVAEAQEVKLGASEKDENWHIVGSADDIEYFDNGEVTKGKGDDWFKVVFQGKEKKLFTANLQLPDPLVVARLRVFHADGTEYKDGANANERVHQQLEEHRTAITRTLNPGGTYYLVVESNSPGYEVELRIRDLAPYNDPRKALRQAMYDHMTQVHAWLLNRPRGAAVERRVRDVGSLLGSICMSCHTQSGIWGPAVAMKNGYELETIHNFRQLANTMYECLRPTNELDEAANNTSLAPLDLGDGPAGTRAAGFNVVHAELVTPAKRLHSAQQQRTANFMLQSADPSGINAAGPGSNYGQAVVYRFAGMILERAWRDTGNRKYLVAMEEKATKLLALKPRWADDYANRILFFRDVFPYAGHKQEKEVMAQLRADEKTLREWQQSDGCWGFEKTTECDAAPTSLALTALAAMGFDDRDAAVQKGVAWLLKAQDPYGRWNKAALTGFVTTAYVEHALARLYPVKPIQVSKEMFLTKKGDSVLDTLARMRALAQRGLDPRDRELIDIATEAAKHPVAAVRYYAQIALGAFRDDRGVPSQLAALGDPSKMVREAARWGMRQTLLDDKGWDLLFATLRNGDELTRESIAGTLVMRADAVMSRSNVGFARLGEALDKMMNEDPAPAVRAWAARAAWNWWIYNPPVRRAVNAAFVRALERDEPVFLVEKALRYQTEALFIANGQKANGSKEHQYPELSELFETLDRKLESRPHPTLENRLTAIAGTFYSQSGGDGGPGQMGYVTPHSATALGKAVLATWKRAESEKNENQLKLSIEAAANIVYDPLQKKLLDYASGGPEHLRTLASTSIADPRLISLPGTQEFLEPLMEQFYRGAADEERRLELVTPLVKLFQRARWNLPKTEEQQKIFYNLLLPKFAPERAKLPENTKQLAQMEKPPVDWYVADQIAAILHNNPDLQTPMLLRFYPQDWTTPMQERMWVAGARWLLRFGQEVPAVGMPVELPSEFSQVRDRAVGLVVKSIEAPSDRRVKQAAVVLAADPVVRKEPKLREVLKKAAPQYFEEEPAEVAKLSPEWKKNWEYFRDWVAPELTKPNREDQMSCLGCHGVAGRVPSMGLNPADNLGYVPMKKLAENYRTLLERVNEADVEKSKLLRKPLNVQSGMEDGHQGGRRYNPNDTAYKILETWVRNAAKLKGAKQVAKQ
ncbi:MAG: hypothetical protein OHK0021_02340 [Bryobacter sp.]